MAYITKEGSLLPSEPWGRRSVTFFMGIIHMVFAFFRSLSNPVIRALGPQSDVSGRYGTSTRDSRPGSGPPRPPSRRIAGFNNRSDLATPGPCPCTSCG